MNLIVAVFIILFFSQIASSQINCPHKDYTVTVNCLCSSSGKVQLLAHSGRYTLDQEGLGPTSDKKRDGLFCKYTPLSWLSYYRIHLPDYGGSGSFQDLQIDNVAQLEPIANVLNKNGGTNRDSDAIGHEAPYLIVSYFLDVATDRAPRYDTLKKFLFTGFEYLYIDGPKNNPVIKKSRRPKREAVSNLSTRMITNIENLENGGQNTGDNDITGNQCEVVLQPIN